jgi:flagellin-like protein
MQLKQLFDDDDAVSPVIGVILMVAITVILAAVIGAFVLNLGGGQESPPQTQWGWSDTNVSGTSSADEVALAHDGGDRVDNPGQITLSNSSNDITLDTLFGTDTISAGAEATVSVNSGETGTFELIWESSDGSQSNVIDTHEYDTNS